MTCKDLLGLGRIVHGSMGTCIVLPSPGADGGGFGFFESGVGIPGTGGVHAGAGRHGRLPAAC